VTDSRTFAISRVAVECLFPHLETRYGMLNTKRWHLVMSPSVVVAPHATEQKYCSALAEDNAARKDDQIVDLENRPSNALPNRAKAKC
jgi:hypothetical protein